MSAMLLPSLPSCTLQHLLNPALIFGGLNVLSWTTYFCEDADFRLKKQSWNLIFISVIKTIQNHNHIVRYQIGSTVASILIHGFLWHRLFRSFRFLSLSHNLCIFPMMVVSGGISLHTIITPELAAELHVSPPSPGKFQIDARKRATPVGSTSKWWFGVTVLGDETSRGHRSEQTNLETQLRIEMKIKINNNNIYTKQQKSYTSIIITR